MSALEKKINHLEQKVLDRKIEPYSTQLYWEESEAETIFFKEFWAMQAKLKTTPENYKFTPYERAIFDQAYKIVVMRFFDVFKTFYEMIFPDEEERVFFLIEFMNLVRKYSHEKRAKP